MLTLAVTPGNVIAIGFTALFILGVAYGLSFDVHRARQTRRERRVPPRPAQVSAWNWPERGPQVARTVDELDALFDVSPNRPGSLT